MRWSANNCVRNDVNPANFLQGTRPYKSCKTTTIMPQILANHPRGHRNPQFEKRCLRGTALLYTSGEQEKGPGI